MRVETALKLAQVAGALIMAAGVASCIAGDPAADRSTAWLFIVGGVLYGGSRMAAWLRAR